MYIEFLIDAFKFFGVHMTWLVSVLSLMPKGEIVGIKSVLPLVTTLGKTIPLPSSSFCIVLTEITRFHRVTIQIKEFTELPFRSQSSPSYHSDHRVHRVTI